MKNLKDKKFMKPLTKWGLAKQAMKIGMFFTVTFAGIQAYKIWTFFQKYPTVEFAYNSFQTVPQELVIKTQMLNTGVNLVYFSLFFYMLFEICSAFELKEKHWLYGRIVKHKIVEKMKNFGDKFEDD